MARNDHKLGRPMASKHAIYISLFPMRSSYVHMDESASDFICRSRRRSPSCPYILSIIGFIADYIMTLSPIQEHRFGMIELSFILGQLELR